jgi:hypothetical protein
MNDESVRLIDDPASWSKLVRPNPDLLDHPGSSSLIG